MLQMYKIATSLNHGIRGNLIRFRLLYENTGAFNGCLQRELSINGISEDMILHPAN